MNEDFLTSDDDDTADYTKLFDKVNNILVAYRPTSVAVGLGDSVDVLRGC